MTTEAQRLEEKGLYRVKFAAYGDDCLVLEGGSETLCGIAVDGDERAGWRRICDACFEIAGERTIAGRGHGGAVRGGL